MATKTKQKPSKAAPAKKPAQKASPAKPAKAAPKAKAAKPAAKPKPPKPATKAKPIKPAAKAPAPRPKAKPKPKAAKPKPSRNYTPHLSEIYMNSKQLAWFARKLREMFDDANDRMGETRGSMPDQVKTYPDENDRASQEAEFTLELRERDRDRNLVRKIRQALKSIEDGSYGFCEECGCKIGLKRLRARPVASMCIDCKILQENREKHHLS